MLQSGKYAKQLKVFIKKVNTMSQQDADKAIAAHCQKQEELIYAAIRSITITIPTGFIQVQGSPAAQTNIAPIVLNNAVK